MSIEWGVSLVTALHCLCVTDWWHPPLCPGDMCSHIFKCHHPGDERVRDYKYHIWSHGANIFNTFSPCLVFSLQWLTEERLAWAEVSQTHSELSARRGGTTNYKARLGHGPQSRLDTSSISSMAHSQLSSTFFKRLTHSHRSHFRLVYHDTHMMTNEHDISSNLKV